MAEDGVAIGGAVEKAFSLLRRHPSIVEADQPTHQPEEGATFISFRVRLGLPNAWMADGRSPNGVLAIEPVTLLFPREYPFRPPRFLLRQDFNRSIAHLNPGSADTPPEPCIYDGSLDELLQREGLSGLLNQLVAWLENAAIDRLIDPEQGWEPARRDSLEDTIVADAGHVRALVNREGGFAYLPFVYCRYQSVPGIDDVHGELINERVTVKANTIADWFMESLYSRESKLRCGRTLALVVWPGKLPSGKPCISGTYQPETVTTLGQLYERAQTYGCEKALREGLQWLESCLAGLAAKYPGPLAILLIARRPFHLLRDDIDLELCPYITMIEAPTMFRDGERSSVRPAGHRHAISVSLLRRMSGVADVLRREWVLLGCGSLGSKIALHLARSGMAPAKVVDRSGLSPHNAARHALIPNAGEMQVTWMTHKAGALSAAIRGFGQDAEACVEDVVLASLYKVRRRRVFRKDALAMVNSTASLTVREALAATSPDESLRIIETTLYAEGKVGFLSVEGPGRNPNTGDLITEAYAAMREDAAVKQLVFADVDHLRRQEIGDGCGSTTMVMSDARLSMFGAAMAEAISRLYVAGLPQDTGKLMIGLLGDDGMGMSWRTSTVGAFRTAEIEDRTDWQVRISPRAHAKIEADIRGWPDVETGGIILGRISEPARTFYVVDTIPAPPDSKRSRTEFLLGTEGVRHAIDAYAESCNFSLYCLGTWHSHLDASHASPKDRATAATVAIARIAPSVLLIHGPAGYRAVLAERKLAP